MATELQNFNLASIGIDTLTESYSAQTAFDLEDAKKSAKSKMNRAQKEVDNLRDKRIEEFNKQAKAMMRGGFLRGFLKIFSVVLKLLKPLHYAIDKVFKGKFKIIGIVLKQIIDRAISVLTAGASDAVQAAMKIIEKVQQIASYVLRAVNAAEDIIKHKDEKDISTANKEAQRYGVQESKALEIFEKLKDQTDDIDSRINRIIESARQNQENNHAADLSLARF